MIIELQLHIERSKGIKALELAKKQELDRVRKGYVWVTKDKISKQVSIETLSDLLNIGWVKL